MLQNVSTISPDRVFARKRKVEQFIGDESRTANQGEKDKIARSEKLWNGDLKGILKRQKHYATAGPLTLENESYRLEDPGSLSRPFCQACCKVVTKNTLELMR